MKLIERFSSSGAEARYSWEDYLSWVDSVYGTTWGDGSGLVPYQTYQPGGTTDSPADMPSFAYGAATGNGPVFSLLAFRMATFSQVRWQWQQMRDGRPGDLFGTPALDLLNSDPWLNVRLIQDVDLAGNAYLHRRGPGLVRLRPDWVSIVFEQSEDDPMARPTPVGYLYHAGGPRETPAERALPIPASEMVHWAPIPDPNARFRGMSWLQPAVTDVKGDNAASTHKLKFFENGATPNMVVKYDPAINFETFLKYKDEFAKQHQGVRNAYKALHIGGGADATVVGVDFKQLDFAVTQGKGETRLASMAGVPPILVGFSEGLNSATYSNYGQARRRWADAGLHTLWVSAAAALGRVQEPPAGARLWYDARDIPFLREDAKDDAEIRQVDANSIKQLVDAGFDADSVIDAVTSGDLKRLKGKHSGLFSVQLQPPGTGEPAANGKQPAAVANGK